MTPLPLELHPLWGASVGFEPTISARDKRGALGHYATKPVGLEGIEPSTFRFWRADTLPTELQAR